MRGRLQRLFPRHYLALRSLAKSGEKLLRDLRLCLAGIPRRLPPLRRLLRLPRPGHVEARTLRAEEGRWLPLGAERPFTRSPIHFPDGTLLPEPLRRHAQGLLPAQGVAVLTKARVWGHHASSIISSGDRLVSDLSKDVWGPGRHSLHLLWRAPRPLRLPGKTLNLVTPEARRNYHHWMIDLLPRLRLVREAGANPGDFDTILIKHSGLPYQLESLDAFGIPREKLRLLGDKEWLECDELWVPSLRLDNTRVPAADLDFVRRTLLRDEAPAPGGRLLYLSRKDAAFRRVRNEHAFLPALRALGFEEVVMSELTLERQAALFSEARLVVSPSSAALANLLFAPRGCHVVELVPSRWIVPYTWMICDNLGHPLHCLLSQDAAPPAEKAQQGVQDDLSIDPELLLSTVSRILKSAESPA